MLNQFAKGLLLGVITEQLFETNSKRVAIIALTLAWKRKRPQ